jgi:CHAD domain-containing protein
MTISAPPLTYAFQPDEKISRGFVRILGEISSRGRGLPRRASKLSGESIHEGRLLIKRVRALLWFAHPALDSAAYMQARVRLRKAAGLLAGQRDLAVTQATLEELGREASPSDRARTAMAQIFRSLAGDPADGKAPEEALRQTLQEAMGILCRSINEIKRNTPHRAEWPSPSDRLAKAFRAMHRAGKKARRTGKDADFHAWRKKAKRLLYQLELTQIEPGRRMVRMMKRVEKLQNTLGACHDCAMVEDRLRQTPPFPSSARRVLSLLKKRKQHLRKRAGKITHRL